MREFLLTSMATGLAGLLISFWATIKLFKKGVGISPIEKLLSVKEQNELTPADLYRDLAKRFNDSIGDSNARATDSFKDDKARLIRWIIVGVVLSVISIIAATIASW
jgi:hypothetical protein